VLCSANICFSFRKFMGHIVGLATSLLSGSKEEWSLVRRHPSETMFGVQVAGSKPTTLVPTAEVIARECSSSGIDFVDLNCGCPIDLVFRTGSGSARTLFAVSVLKQNVERSSSLTVLCAAGKLGKILIGMNKALGEIPLTIKMRTGVKEGHNNAHKLMPRIGAEWNVAAMAVSPPSLFTSIRRIQTALRRSCMVERDNSDTPS